MIKNWQMDCSMFDGDLLSGPVPVLFSDKVEDTKQALVEDPIKVHADIMRIHKTFFLPEVVSMADMAGLLKKPR